MKTKVEARSPGSPREDFYAGITHFANRARAIHTQLGSIENTVQEHKICAFLIL
jgi:hypothetical protein